MNADTGSDRYISRLDEQAEHELAMLERASKRAESADSAESVQRRGFQRADSARSLADFRQCVDDDTTWDVLATAPKPTETMFYGLLGEMATLAADGTEVNPSSAMAAGMVWLSATMGRNTCIAVGNEWHHLRLYGLHVGRSSRGGKGMSLALLDRVRKAIAERHGEATYGNVHRGGLSSREGLALLIRDGYKDGKQDIEPIIDKRLFIVESEFANVLSQAKRDGNTLSSALRDCWDGVSIKPATKSSRIWASRPHVALHGCITPSELRNKIASNELSNGFANRFLILWAERIGSKPFPARASDAQVEALADRFATVIDFGRAGYPDADTPQRLSFERKAIGLYADLYDHYRKPHPAGELVTGLLERRAPMLLRMAGLFAITDLSTVIERQHVAAAGAWIDYYTQSVAMVFAPMVDAFSEAQRNEDAEKLHTYLSERGAWTGRTDISNDCFKKRLPKQDLDAAIESLALEDRIERREMDTGGVRRRTEYRAVQPTAPKTPQDSAQTPQPETRVIPKVPQNPQTPHTETENNTLSGTVDVEVLEL
ncbi:MAG: DUF3987 domain-containing protein [Proteobacteria bacterium]|nr:DUF3987 domain-containing protein [Pseudomonadota bacterium]